MGRRGPEIRRAARATAGSGGGEGEGAPVEAWVAGRELEGPAEQRSADDADGHHRNEPPGTVGATTATGEPTDRG